MACTVHVAWDERLTDYHFGPGDGPWPLAGLFAHGGRSTYPGEL